MRQLSGTFATALAMGLGFLTTLSLLLDGTGVLVPLLASVGLEQPIRDFLPNILQLVSITVAFAILVGLVNLIGVHILRVARVRRDAVWSLLLLVSSLGVIAITVLERSGSLQSPFGEPAYTTLLRNTVQYSVEASLAGLLAFSLVFGAYRFLRDRVTPERVVFIFALIVGLVVQANFALPEPAQAVRQHIIDAGSSGLLLGIALATVIAGVRVLIGQDRSYRE